MDMTRREMLATGLASMGALAMTDAAEASDMPTVRTPIAFAVAAGATDCYVHTYLDPASYPMQPKRLYTPTMATADDLLRFQKALHMSRVVVVTASVYGTDNHATHDTLKRLGRKRACGVGVIGPQTSDAQLRERDGAGFRGARVITALDPATDLTAIRAQIKRIASQIKGDGWHLQLYGALAVLAQLRKEIEAADLPVVLDHIAGIDAKAGSRRAGWGDSIAWSRAGKSWVKLSGAFYASQAHPDFADVAPFVHALVEAAPDSLSGAATGRILAGQRPRSKPAAPMAAGNRPPTRRRRAYAQSARGLGDRRRYSQRDPRRQSATPVWIRLRPLLSQTRPRSMMRDRRLQANHR